MQEEINIAYIDAANLDKSTRASGWKIDHLKLRVWLADKFRVEQAYVFIGYVPKYEKLYTHLNGAGFTLVFKEVIYGDSGLVKGNRDADLVVQSLTDAYEGNLKKGLLVSSDGDYSPLVKKLNSRKQLLGILSPAPANKCSILLKKTGVSVWYMQEQKHHLMRL